MSRASEDSCQSFVSKTSCQTERSLTVPKDREERRRASKSRASKILGTKLAHEEILKDPAHASLPDGSPLLEHFRGVFETLKGDSDAGVTPCKLEAALRAFAGALPDAVAMRIAFVVSEVFEEIDRSQVGAITWPDFVEWLRKRDTHDADSDEALSELFELCDADGTGKISAQELLDVLLLTSQLSGSEGASHGLTVETAEAIVRDLDSGGRGGIGIFEFTEVIRAARAKHRGESGAAKSAADGGAGGPGGAGDGLPHLALSFDINNTVIMLDSATGADSLKLLGAVFANAAWGSVERDAGGQPAGWVMRHPEVSILAPVPGLVTYKEYVDLENPMREGREHKEANERAKLRRRAAIWTFTDPGQPGEALRDRLLEVNAALQLPEEVRGSERALAAGLTGDSVQLLPSFLRLLRELKQSGRSFTLMFRTFGHDLERVQKELNALCEGRHPLFPEDDGVVLDGSDGQPDYRMHLDSPQACGTFFRDPPQDVIGLAMGTIVQPRTLEEGMGFYDGLERVEQLHGHQAVASRFVEISGQRRTVALRDFYLGWAAAGSTSLGGKPFFHSCHYDPSRHSIFFDDNITAADPRIVDPINAHHWPQRFSCPQLFGVHLVQAQPLHSIVNPDYFLDCVRECEAARRAKLQRWELAQQLFGDLAGMQHILTTLVRGSTQLNDALSMPISHFHPWCEDQAVLRAPHADTFEEDAPVEVE